MPRNVQRASHRRSFFFGEQPRPRLMQRFAERLSDRQAEHGHERSGAASRESSKTYSLDQVNACLPRVTGLLQTTLQLRAQLKQMYGALESRGYPPGESFTNLPEGIARDHAVFAALVDALGDLVRELGETGCVIRDLELGLVDWRGEKNGRPVWLCWKLGEPAVSHYHELDRGFDARKPLFAAPVRSYDA